MDPYQGAPLSSQSSDTSDTSSDATIEQCPRCRVALHSVVVVTRAKADSLLELARQLYADAHQLAGLLRDARFDLAADGF